MEGRRRPGGRKHWKFWHWSRTQVTGTEAAGKRTLRASPKGRRRKSPSHPQEVPAHRQSHQGISTLAGRQVINTWSLAPSRGIWETWIFPGPSPSPSTPFLPRFPKRLQSRSLCSLSSSHCPHLTCWWMNREALGCHWSKGSRIVPLRASLDGGGGTGGGTAISWYVWFPVGYE